MNRWLLGGGLTLALITATSALAAPAGGVDPLDGASLPAEQPYLQCVPYARQVSGLQIYGDAWTWWDQAEGRYERGYRPQVGAVMAFKPYGSMRLGHVAAVSRVIDSRTVLLRHANWSPIDGRRGQIEEGVPAVDVSPDNDWSEVRVWYDPVEDLGKTVWPVAGFIYNRPLGGSPTQLARAVAPAAEPTVGDPIGAIIASRSSARSAPRIGYAELER